MLFLGHNDTRVLARRTVYSLHLPTYQQHVDSSVASLHAQGKTPYLIPSTQ
jgi:hypothetical protein